MSNALMRLSVLLLFVLALAAFGATGSSAAVMSGETTPLQVEPTPEAIEDLIPCDPSYNRTIDPRIFKVGEETTVETTYNFNCTGRSRKLNFLLVIENSGALRQGRGGREALDNVIKGTQYFVNQVDYANGSRGGLVLYASDRTIRQPLQGGDEGQQNLIRILGDISIEPIGNSAGAGAAIRDATGLLPTGVQSDAKNIMIIVDAGAMEVPGSSIVDRYTACNAARQSGVTVAVVSFPAAQRRLTVCSTGGYFKQVSNDTGTNVQKIFSDLAEAMLRGKMMQDVEYSDFLQDGFDIVPGSESKPPSSSWQTQYFWALGNTAPQTIRYNVRAADDLFVTGQTRKLSEGAELLFRFQDGTDARVKLPNPDICVYRVDPGECAGKIPTETPVVPPTTAPPSATTPPPTDTPVTPGTPTDIPTQPPASETPTTETPLPSTGPPTIVPPTDVPTVEPPTRYTIHMPAAYRKG